MHPLCLLFLSLTVNLPKVNNSHATAGMLCCLETASIKLMGFPSLKSVLPQSLGYEQNSLTTYNTNCAQGSPFSRL